MRFTSPGDSVGLRPTHYGVSESRKTIANQQDLLDKTVQLQMRRRSCVKEAAIDLTGLNATSASAYEASFHLEKSVENDDLPSFSQTRFGDYCGESFHPCMWYQGRGHVLMLSLIHI